MGLADSEPKFQMRSLVLGLSLRSVTLSEDLRARLNPQLQ